MKGRHPVGLMLLSFMGYVLVLTCVVGQIQVNVERSVVSMVDVHIDVPSDFNGASEQIYHLENSDQKGAMPV